MSDVTDTETDTDFELDDRAKELLAQLEAAAALTLPKNQAFCTATRDGKPWLALLLKRTYRIARGGRCEPVSEDEENPIVFDEVPYANARPPFVSAPIAVNDEYAFKAATDVVLQASAHAYAEGTRKSTARVRFGRVTREIAVFGDRRIERDRFGRWRFTEPEPFEEIPIRADHAYGGLDLGAFLRGDLSELQELHRIRPEWGALARTPFHYPRNPAGCGYMIELDERAPRVSVPNLEHPFDPLSPERLAVGAVTKWIRGALPAHWDFQSELWFPRCAYLGGTPTFEPGGDPPAEVVRGWAPEDILSIESPLRSKTGEVRDELAQAAAPGMTATGVTANQVFELEGMHPEEPVYRLTLPGEIPEVRIAIEDGGEPTVFFPHLNTVVLRLSLDEVEIVWSARAEVSREMDELELLKKERSIRWRRVGEA